jgi:uncharacterized protein YmfQ (DUF2313 family)
MSISRGVIDALLPSGSIWNIEQDGDLDKLLDGSGASWDDVVNFIESLAHLRDPLRTTILSDLEREYGIVPDDLITEETRRMQLAVIVYNNRITGSDDSLQGALDAAGFNVQVHNNSPAIDPAIVLDQNFLMVAQGDNAYAGFIPTGETETTAVAGRTGGELLVNGREITQRPDFLAVAENDVWAGDEDAVAGRYDVLIETETEYVIPTESDRWPFVFFIGGDATRDVDGRITEVERAEIPSERQNVFENIILKYKPLHSWAGLVITYT